MTPLKTLRLCVVRDDKAASFVWLAGSNAEGFYVGTRSPKGICKVVMAFNTLRLDVAPATREPRPQSPGMTVATCPRIAVPEVGVIKALSILFPTDETTTFGRARKGTLGKAITRLNAAPKGHAVEVAFYYSRQWPDELKAFVSDLGEPLGFWSLKGGQMIYAFRAIRPFTVATSTPLSTILPGLHLIEADGTGTMHLLQLTDVGPRKTTETERSDQGPSRDRILSAYFSG